VHGVIARIVVVTFGAESGDIGDREMGIVLIALYLAVLLLLCGYGIHRARLAWRCWRYQPSPPLETLQLPSPQGPLDGAAKKRLDELPFVTVQLPIYNEATVVQRLLEAANALSYPRDKLEIQVLDDSDDETRVLAESMVHRLRDGGLDINYLRRTSREGYKAGALDYGLRSARGELIAIFDADFVPPPDFLLATVGHFREADVGMVQGRWGHLNRDASLLTNLQALMLDGHHLVENRARYSSGCYFNFSGTAGIWRRQAIEGAGGWQHDTLTEDLDLSYRAQLAGWRFVYRPDVVAPSELPEDVFAFRAQQYRWAKGTVQTARKLLPGVLRGSLTRDQRLEALFHLTPHFAYPLMVLLCLLLPFALVLLPVADNWVALLIIDVPLCFGASGSLAAFYAMANKAQGRPVGEALMRLPALMALGIGLSPYLSRAVLEGLTQDAGEFVRTPKRGLRASRYRQLRVPLPITELALALVGVASVAISLETNHYLATPFALLFALGYAYMAGLMTTEQLARRRALAPSAASVIAKI
jgi:cellulose synthase/poly-beta-1,6-N-acetylglucosamine synthase-like glycosyltransferase